MKLSQISENERDEIIKMLRGEYIPWKMSELTKKELKIYHSTLIKNSELRFISYKVLLGDLFKEKKLYHADDFEWLRIHFKELKTFEERIWKALVNEWTTIKQEYGI